MRRNLLATAAIYCLVLPPVSSALAAPEAAPANAGLHAATLTALQHTSGRVLEVDREHEDGKQVYEIDIVHDGQITEVKVDAATGKVIGAETDDVKHRIKQLLISDKKLNALKEAEVSLPEAVAKAEKETQAKAVEAEFEYEDSRYAYEITLKANNRRIRVLVDANTGVVRKD